MLTLSVHSTLNLGMAGGAAIVFGNRIPISDIYIKVLISEIVYENWMVVAVNREVHASLWCFCSLRSGLRKCLKLTESSLS